MKVVIIGASGHYHQVFDAISGGLKVDIAAVAPGSKGENMTKLLSRTDAKVYEDWKEMLDAEKALEGTRLKVPDEVTDEICEVCGRNLVVKIGRFGKFLACPGFPECKTTRPIVEKMPGRCPKCGSTIYKRKSKKGYAYYGCERGAECGFMTWDMPTAEDCPKCGQTMFKKSGRGRMKPFCINESCENFLPEDKRGYYKKSAKTKEKK